MQKDSWHCPRNSLFYFTEAGEILQLSRTVELKNGITTAQVPVSPYQYLEECIKFWKSSVSSLVCIMLIAIIISFLFIIGSEETQSVYWIYLLRTDFMSQETVHVLSPLLK